MPAANKQDFEWSAQPSDESVLDYTPVYDAGFRSMCLMTGLGLFFV